MTSFERYMPAVGRALMAVLFLMSGIGKIAAPGPTLGYIVAMGLPAPQVALGVAILIEIGGGLLLLLGYRTRIVSILLALFTLVTAAIFHSDFADQNQMIHFLKNVAIAGGLLNIAAFGAGAFSLDARSARTVGHGTRSVPA
ncbi:DoxX family protein [uncultured Sphingomonas sp.]|uniref:DoxX family protein n=1 Tax=uncultured Sphingomonas sp. TaxID=158754 RepID=UPI0035C960C6